MPPRKQFSLLATSGAARRGKLHLPHGTIDTPVFMPVGTKASVKAMDFRMLSHMQCQILLANTFHLSLRPGVDIIDEAGGLHQFCGWDANILTDSGGFQIWSLKKLRKIHRKGVDFRSPYDGSLHRFTPESVVDAQNAFRSDIQMVLDYCAPYGISKEETKEAMTLTHDWAARARNHFHSSVGVDRGLLQFGIVQGGFFSDLREQSCEAILSMDFDGIALGGLSVGEPFALYQQSLEEQVPLLPENLPRYVMGIGTPQYIFAAVKAGIDMFDCVFPTRIARNATIFTEEGPRHIRNARFRGSREVLPGLEGRYTFGYLHHLFKAKEILACMLATEINIHFMLQLLQRIRQAITENRLEQLSQEFFQHYV